jgi:hypothetical protein
MGGALLALGGLLGMAAGFGTGGAVTAGVDQARAGAQAERGQPTDRSGSTGASQAAKAAQLRSFFGAGWGRSKRYPRGPGWTHAQVQRMARKRRQVLRQRARGRGRKARLAKGR